QCCSRANANSRLLLQNAPSSGRRTYITRLANKGVGVRLLAALAGHSHISTTQRYIDVNSEQLSEAVELL
ncbi:site-specific integrase, partial [Planktomarina temperata]|nr:site-specific integrase [Planktomarina temperata]MDA8987599.1 site-specific integrase [Planktomarina temperata]